MRNDAVFKKNVHFQLKISEKCAKSHCGGFK